MANKRKKPSDTVVFMPALYDETLLLLAEAHRYFEGPGVAEQRDMGERLRTMYISEMSRVTVRLSCVMAWLLARRAVSDGTITADEANARYRLECRETSLHQHIEAETVLPDTLTDMLDKSYELYARVARLDEESQKGKA